jgi:hypothetical protein
MGSALDFPLQNLVASFEQEDLILLGDLLSPGDLTILLMVIVAAIVLAWAWYHPL